MVWIYIIVEESRIPTPTSPNNIALPMGKGGGEGQNLWKKKKPRSTLIWILHFANKYKWPFYGFS